MAETFPTEFGRYQLIERLAVGGMAELFRARVLGAHGFQKPVVIKKILPHLASDGAFVAMFIDEAKITARLDHPKIAQVLELGTIADQLYIAMEFVDGADVLEILRACAHRKQAMPSRLAAHVAHEILDALDYAHQATDDDGRPLGIVHRDISPSNVLVSRRGDVKLADFGIAHAVERQQKTRAGMLKGKYGYMSPEQVVGADLDARSDLFSVGIVLAEMLMGRRLFTAPNELDVLLMVRDVRLDRLERYGSAIEPGLRTILAHALTREVKARFPHAAAFRDALAEWLFVERKRVTPADVSSFVVDLLPQIGARGTAVPGLMVGAMSAAAALAGAAPLQPDALSPAAAQPQPPAAATSRAAAAVSPPPSMKVPVVASPPPSMKVPVVAGPRAAMVRGAVPVGSAGGPGWPSGGAGWPSGGPGWPTAAPRVAAAARGPAALTAASDVPFAVNNNDTARLSVETVLSPDADLSGPAVPIVHAALVDDSDSGPSGPRPLESDFIDLAVELGLRPDPVRREPAPLPEVPPDLSMLPAPPIGDVGRQLERPDVEGELEQTPPIRLLYKLAAESRTGLLVVEAGAIRKEIYFVGGVPEYVASNSAQDLFGEYLVAQKVIAQGELAMALAMMPHFGGRLGDTLVGLGLIKPLDVFRHLTRQVRDKLVDVCTWQAGGFRWFGDKRNLREAFPLGLDAFEVLGAGAAALPREPIEAWAVTQLDRSPVAAKNPRIVPEVFRLGSYPRDVYNRLDGRVRLREILGRFTSTEDRAVYLRTLYLLVQTELALLS